MGQAKVAHINIDDHHFKSVISRHRSFWERGEEDSFLFSAGPASTPAHLPLRQADGSYLSRAERLVPDMVDVSALVDEVEEWERDRLDDTPEEQRPDLITTGHGDAIPMSRPPSKFPWVEAMLGCPVRMMEGQIWPEYYPGDPEEVVRRGARLDRNPWLQLYVEFLRQLQSRIGGRFPVSANTLLRGTCDLAATVMGVEEACIGWIQSPGFMSRLLRVCTDAVLAVVEAGYQVLEPFEGGYPSGFAIWAPGQVVGTQADHSVLLSARTYKEQILPYDREVIGSRPYSIIHLHSAGLRMVPLLVEVPELNAIQVSLDPSPTPQRDPRELEMIQLVAEHKPLITGSTNLREGEWLLENLPRRGLRFDLRYDPDENESLPYGYPGTQTWVLG